MQITNKSGSKCSDPNLHGCVRAGESCRGGDDCCMQCAVTFTYSSSSGGRPPGWCNDTGCYSYQRRLAHVGIMMSPRYGEPSASVPIVDIYGPACCARRLADFVPYIFSLDKDKICNGGFRVQLLRLFSFASVVQSSISTG